MVLTVLQAVGTFLFLPRGGYSGGRGGLPWTRRLEPFFVPKIGKIAGGEGPGAEPAARGEGLGRRPRSRAGPAGVQAGLLEKCVRWLS